VRARVGLCDFDFKKVQGLAEWLTLSSKHEALSSNLSTTKKKKKVSCGKMHIRFSILTIFVCTFQKC
jgi:hypothetical protein